MGVRGFQRAAVILAVLTVVLTWPQAGWPGTRVADHRDAFFSMWRLAWVAHALETSPRHLYDSNIYYPEPNTFTLSDATLLQGIIAAPFLWLGVSPAWIYNLLLLGGITVSGLAMFVLVRYLTRDEHAAVVAGAVYTLLPYRVEHFVHFEMQWTMFIPLAFWAVHRAFDESSWRFGVLAGVFVWLQFVAGMYNATFLALVLPVLTLLVALSARHRLIGLMAVMAGGVVAMLLTYPLARPYIRNSSQLTRSTDAVDRFSAQPSSYISAPRRNRLWGWTGQRFGGNERHLFPGAVAIGLALVGLACGARRVVAVYVAIGLLAMELSLGFNGHLYGWVYRHAWPVQSLRAIARFSIIAFSALSVIAGYGIACVRRRCDNRRFASWIPACAIALLVVDTFSAPMALTPVSVTPPSVYSTLKQLPDGAVVELPALRPDVSEVFDPRYQFWSRVHWKPLVNGYSGGTPPGYVETQRLLETFPDTASLQRLVDLNVRYVVVHAQLYPPGSTADLFARIRTRPELISRGTYADWIGGAELFELHDRKR